MTSADNDFQKRFLFYVNKTLDTPGVPLNLSQISRRVASDQIAEYMREYIKETKY